MTVDDDNARELIVAQLNEHVCSESPKHLPNDEYHRQFVNPWHLVNLNHLEKANLSSNNGGHDAIYCRSCLVDKGNGRIKAWRLFVEYEENVSEYAHCELLVHVSCHNCDFDMYAPVKEQQQRAASGSLSASQLQTMQKEIMKHYIDESMLEKIVKKERPSPAMLPPPKRIAVGSWDEQQKALEEHMRKRAIKP